MTTTVYEQILFERRGRVGLITFNRPEKLNPWSRVMAHEICDAIQRCNGDDAVGAIVLTGPGGATVPEPRFHPRERRRKPEILWKDSALIANPFHSSFASQNRLSARSTVPQLASA